MVVPFDELPTEVRWMILGREQMKRWPAEVEKWQTVNGEWHLIRHDFNSYGLVCKAFRALLETVVIEPSMLESLTKHATETVICREASKLQGSNISSNRVTNALVQVARRGLSRALPIIYQLVPPGKAKLVLALEAAIVNAAATDQMRILGELLASRKPLPDLESL